MPPLYINYNIVIYLAVSMVALCTVLILFGSTLHKPFSGTSILPVIACWHWSVASVTLCYCHKCQISQYRSGSLGHACHVSHSLHSHRSRCFPAPRRHGPARSGKKGLAHVVSLPPFVWPDKTFYQKHRLFTLGSSQASTWPPWPS